MLTHILISIRWKTEDMTGARNARARHGKNEMKQLRPMTR